MLSISRNFSSKIFSGITEPSQAEKNKLFTFFFTVVVRVLLAVSRTAISDVYHTSLSSPSDAI